MKILSLIKKQLPQILLTTFLHALSALCALFMPYEMGIIVSQGIKLQNATILKECGITMGVLAISTLVLSLVTVRLNAKISNDFEKQLKISVFKKINSLTFEEFSSIGTSGLLTRVNDDISTLRQTFSNTIFLIISILVYYVGGVVLVMIKDKLIGIIMLCISPIVLLICWLLASKLDKLWEYGDKMADAQNKHVRERMSGIRVLRAFDKEQEKHNKTSEATKEMVLSFITANRLSGLINPIITVVFSLATVAIIAVSADRISYQSALNAGDIISSIQYISLISSGLLMLSWSLSWLPHVAVSARRIGDIFAFNENKSDENGELLTGDINIKDLTFTYPEAGAPTLKNINFSIKQGQKVAIIGGTGSGKSTLIKLLLNFYQPDSGTINFGGTLYTKTNFKQVRKSVSVALQKAMIFQGTLLDNITCFSNEYSEEKVKEVVSVAQLDQFLVEKGGLSFELKQLGSNVSGGQKQRINIARTIIKDSSLYIFDDSFSALDFLTESQLRSRLREYLKGKSQLIITQRISTAMHCDSIYVMDRGEIIAFGSHEELLKNCEVYSQLYQSQIGGGL